MPIVHYLAADVDAAPAFPRLPGSLWDRARRNPAGNRSSRRSALEAIALTVAAAFIAPAALGQARPEQRFPDIVAVKARASGPDIFDFDVTVSSPYDTPARYADAFRVSTLAGEVLGERKLLHDHQGEQPFTRDLYSVKVPRQIKTVVVQGRDQKYGYGGKTVQVQLPGR